MKNKTWILTKILLKNGEGFGIRSMKNKVSKVLMTLLLLGILPMMVVMLSFFIIAVYDMLAQIGQEGIIISWGIAMTSLIIFIFGIFYIIGSFYFSRDIESLLPLPLKPGQIVAAKYFNVAVYEYLITAAVFILLGAFNATASTAISREGQELFVKKYIPASYHIQILAKVLSGFVLGMAGALLMLAVILVMFGLPLLLALLILATGWLGILLTSFTGILIDLYNPKLSWDSEVKAVKQNLNVIYNMIAGIVLGGPALYAAITFSPGIATSLVIVIGVYGGLNVLLYSLIRTKGVKRFQAFEG